MMDLSLVPYAPASGGAPARYRECMRNHAAAMGGHAYDGCGEFMASGHDGSADALKCAACGCHRNFHRRDGTAGGSPFGYKNVPSPAASFPAGPFLPLPYHAMPPPPVAQQPPAFSPPSHPSARKRHRTKFTPEQKERMREFAEKLGWRMQRNDDGALDRFCVEIGVSRHVLKVWMHNHKNNLASPVLPRAGAGDDAAAGDGDGGGALPGDSGSPSMSGDGCDTPSPACG